MNVLALLSTLKETATIFWSERNARQRTLLMSAGLAVALYLIYAIFFGPAMNGRAQLSKDLPELRQQVAELQAMAKQAATLNTAGAVTVAPVSQESVTAALTGLGVKPQSLAVTDDLVRVQLNPVSFAGLLGWIDGQQKATHLVLIDANFVALSKTDMVNATLTFRQQKSEEKFE
jgi:general secretion pathway protein M